MSIKDTLSEKASIPCDATADIDSINEYEHVNQYAHGVKREAQGSSFLAYFNIVCVVCGMGALQLPFALKQGGWIGLLILCLSWFFSTYSSIILIRCLYYDGRTRLTTYQAVAIAAFGKIGGWIAFFFTAVTLIGVPVLYVMLAGQNLYELCSGTSAQLTYPIWTIICAAAVGIPFIFCKSLKEVGFSSLIGVLTTAITVLIVLGVAVQDDRYPNVHHDPVIWDQFPVALSSIAFSYGGNPVYPNAEAGMRHPEHWNRVVFAGLSTCTAIYFVSAVPGYYIYGDQSLSPIYSNLPNGAPKIASIVLMTVHVLLAMPVLMTSFALDVEKMLRISTFHHSRLLEFVLRCLLRVTYMVAVVLIAVYVPSFGNIMSLLGAFSNCALIFIFPVLFYYRLTGLFNKPWYELIFGFLAVALGIVGLIFGSKSAIEALIEEFN